MVVQTDDGTQNALAVGGDLPASGVGYFAYEASHVEFLELSADGRGLPQALLWCVSLAAKDAPDVAVSEALQEVFPAKHGLEEAHIGRFGRIKACVASLCNHLGLHKRLHLLIPRAGIVHHAQGVQVTVVGPVRG